MSQISNYVRKLIYLVGELWFSPQYALQEEKEFPTQVKNGVVYIISEGPEPDTIIFKCPCGCDEVIYLNLLKDTWPCWDFKISWFGLVSILPSVRRKVRCKSHFYLTSGRVKNCSNFFDY